MRRVHRVVQGVWLAVGALAVGLFLAQGAVEAEAGGALVIHVRAGGEPAAAKVVVKQATAEGEQVAEGRAEHPIPLANGTYDVEITCTDLIDHPTQELRGITVSGETVEREVSFPAGTVTLHVKRGGRVLRNTKMQLHKVGGDPLPGVARTGVPFRASPGQYEAEIVLGRGRSKLAHTITGIQVYDGAKRNIAVDL